MAATPRPVYGLVGSGMMGQEHIRNVALLQPDSLRPVFGAVLDPDDAMRARALALLAAAAADAGGGGGSVDDGAAAAAPPATPSSLSELLELPTLSALLVASPNHLHAEQLRTIFAQRAAAPLPVLVEKPACTSLADVASLRAAAAHYGAAVWVAMEYR